MVEQIDKLTVVVTSGNPERIRYALGLYANSRQENPWWQHFHIILHEKVIELIRDREEFQGTTAALVQDGVLIEACRECCILYDAVEVMESIGVIVKEMEHPLMDINDQASLWVE